MKADSAKRPFLNNWLRWFFWLFILGVASQWGILAARVFHGQWVDGVIGFVTGAFVYVLLAALASAAVALIATLFPSIRKTLPTAIGIGAVIALLIGVPIGTLGLLEQIPNQQARAAVLTSSCTNANIEAKFQEVNKLYGRLAESTARLRTYAAVADHIWSRPLDCTVRNPKISQEELSKYLDVLLIGNGDSAFIYYDAKRYAAAREHLDAYVTLVTEMRPIAKKRGWSGWLKFDSEFTPTIQKYDRLLTQRGYPKSAN